MAWFSIVRKRIWLGALLIGLGAYALISWISYIDPYQHRQVADYPSSERSAPFVKQIQQHIRATPRPAETFSFPIPLGGVGPVEPLFAGSNQYPFFCMTEDSGLGQPLVDNQQGWGIPIYASDDKGRKTEQLIGYSTDCLLPSGLLFYYQKPNGDFRRFDPARPPAVNAMRMVERDGGQYPMILRIEHGTINRYQYMIIMPVRLPEGLDRRSHSLWNRRLIYQFRGGSGIGFRQGKLRITGILQRRAAQLEMGYAVINSSVNRTSYTYNMLLSEDTSMRVKRQFVSLYGEPLYTVGVGGSGGGLAQYLLAQNRPGLIDAAMPLYSYPDMITQTIYGLDCELIEHYFAVNALDRNRWKNWSIRQSILGLNSRQGKPHKYAWLQPINQLAAGVWPDMPDGNSECQNGWFGLTSLIHNPRQGYLKGYFSEAIQQQVHWSHWEDMVAIYGRDQHGFARTTWDNQGVQYGLVALREGQLSIEEFLHLNRRIGGWRPQHRMRPERLFHLFGPGQEPLWLSLWSRHNIKKSLGDAVVARTKGDPQAIQMAYRSGQVFIGNIAIPILDIRHYLEPKLNMHHVSATFEARSRIQDWRGHADNQVIWMSHPDFAPQSQGFAAIDRWMANRRAAPNLSAQQTRPATLQDSCFDRNGAVIAAGAGVWDGDWNQQPPGACSQVYPSFSTSRIQAGGPWQGGIFRCHLISVDEAVARGVYGGVNIWPHLQHLQQIFPDGVCDFGKGDAARPADLTPGDSVYTGSAEITG